MDRHELRGSVSQEQKDELVKGNYWTTSQLAKALAFSQIYIQLRCRDGTIKAIRYNSKWRIPRSEVKRLLKDGLKRPPQPSPKSIPIEHLRTTKEEQRLIEPEVRTPWWQRKITLFEQVEEKETK